MASLLDHTIPGLAALAANLGRLAPRDRDFAESLLDAARGRGLSAKQLPWVAQLVERATAPAPEPLALGGDIAGLIALLDKACENLKRPQLLVRAGNSNLRLTIAGPASRHPGTINVTDTAAGEDREWFGRIYRDGSFEPSRKLGRETSTAILAALRAMAADPASTAKLYGQVTGHCCFCGLELTDARSIKVGYGPICAEHFGLPWGDAS